MAANELKASIIVDAPGVEQTLGKVAAGIQKTEAQFKRLAPASNSATLALTNVGRVAQDLPFGFLGIANNLNPLLESFQRLRAESGSTTTALGAMGKSLIGAGGIGLALSVVSSALIVFGDKLFGSKKSVEDNAEALKLLDQELKNAKKSMDEMSKSIEFFSQLGKLNIEVGFGSGLQATVLGLHQEITTLQQEFVDLAGVQEKAIKRVTDFRLQSIIKEGKVNEDEARKLQEFADTVTAKVDENKKRQSLLRAQIRVAESNDLRAQLKEQEEARAAALKKERDEAERQAKRLLEIRAKFFADVERDARKKVGLFDSDALQEEMNQGQFQAPDISKKLSKSVLHENLGGAIEKEEKARIKRQKEYNDQLDRTAATISGAVVPAFDAMFDAILSGENPLKAFFNGLMQGVTDLIKQLIAAAIKALILKAITSGSPAGALAGFIPGVGGGVGIGGTANPGNFFGGGRSININHTGSLVARGNDLVYVFNRTERSQGRTF